MSEKNGVLCRRSVQSPGRNPGWLGERMLFEFDDEDDARKNDKGDKP
jgi:hypothetical protein